MTTINNKLKAELYSFEYTELERLLETLEDYQLYANALHSINGGYAVAEAYDIDLDLDEDDDIVFIETEHGEQNMGDGISHCTKMCCSISRKVLADKDLTIKEKLEKVDWN